MKVIVTGGTGFIGSHTVVEILNAGMQVVIIDNLSNSNVEVLDGIEKICGKRPIFYQKDVSRLEDIDAIFSEHKDADAVVHFAAFKSVNESVEKPLAYYKNNLDGLINIMSLMQKYQINNLVFSSSCTVYGQPKGLPVTENSPIVKSESPYGNTKIICEQIIEDTIKSNPALKSISLRYFNPIGAHPSANIGELPNGVPNNLMPYITQTAMGIREKLLVFGDDYNTPDGSGIRDYINVVDLANAHLCAINRLSNNLNTNNYEVFNIGTGNGVSVLELVKTFEKSTGATLKYEIAKRRQGDIDKIWADTTKANTVLNWQACTSLEDTVKSAWNWEKKLKDRNNS